jgi:hypothetical protein
MLDLEVDNVLIYIPKALAAVFLMCSLYVILLAKMTQRCLTLITNGSSIHLVGDCPQRAKLEETRVEL